ncbi:CheR family methyltransferase [Nitrosophilus alvini]|uniref:CheR family methyltransferase n=1 Tax=Nitrosophilus alvini TaxID=2714855 RepID=UPI00190AF8E3|nr:protein-glutamate O-methyltransferase CheR [Nitrosophilus alvini]
MNKCMKDILSLFKKETGIVFENKLHILEKKIGKFFTDLNFATCEIFLSQLKSNKKLFQYFIDSLTVSESYFYRETKHFDIIVEILKRKRGNKRVLSIPCSSGEEPYTLLIYCLEHDVKLNDLQITGVDINSKVIEIAKLGRYSSRRVNNVPKEILEKYFYKEGDFYYFKDEYKEHIKFERMNLFELSSMKMGKFDIVISRNLFIYFDNETRQKALKVFHSIIKPGGCLILGHADTVKNMIGFEKKLINGVVIYEKI